MNLGWGSHPEDGPNWSKNGLHRTLHRRAGKRRRQNPVMAAIARLEREERKKKIVVGKIIPP